MPKNKDIFDGKRRAQGLPAAGIYSGRRPAPGGINAKIGGADFYAGADYAKNADAGYVSGADADAGYASGACTGAVGGAAAGVRYEPTFGAALAYAAAKDAYSKDAAARKAARDGAAPKRAFMGGASGGAGGSERVRAIAERLAAVLEGEAALYRDAVDISAKKTDIIVRGKIEELDSLVKAEQIIILKIGKLEDERERIIGELSEELDVSLQGAALSDISSYVDEGSYARLNDCHKSLSHTLGDLRNTNEMNSQLLQNALDYVNFSVNLITSNQDAGNIYTQDGDDGGAGRRRRSVFDVKL